MTHPLSKVPFFGKFVDERFLEYRRRSTSVGGIVSTLLAVALFEYRYFHDHMISWDLLAVAFAPQPKHPPSALRHGRGHRRRRQHRQRRGGQRRQEIRSPHACRLEFERASARCRPR